LVNKGLEVIEAHLLFDVAYDDIAVVVHPQSLVHSMVEFTDGSTLAQVSPPDMRLPIALALGWPDRVPGAQPAMDWTAAHELTFEPLDEAAFPAVELARRAGRAGGTAPGVLNAANEEAVDAFRAGRIGFLEIVETVTAVVDEHLLEMSETGLGNSPTLAEVLSAERRARERARTLTGLTVAGVS
jgi:1-deoxy-D-xylulose-5-phosphate reductoisomerase